MSLLLVFESPSIQWPLPEQEHSVARFTSTRGAASQQLPISKVQEVQGGLAHLVALAENYLPFSKVEDCNLWTYFHGISVLQYRLDVGRGPESQVELEQWDSLTDDLQKDLHHSLAESLGIPVSAMWTTVMYVSNSSENASTVMRSYLPEVTKTKPLPSSGFVNAGICGIGMSWLELDNVIMTQDEPTPLDVVVTTARDAVAFCAAIYSLYDRAVVDYGKWLQKRNPRSRSSAATRFRYVESIRVHRKLRLGPSERGLNDGLWEVWGMPELVSSLESLVDRFENETQSATQIAIGRAQNALAVTAALIVPFVSADEIEGLLSESVRPPTSAIVVATGLVEAAIALLIYAMARRRRRN